MLRGKTALTIGCGISGLVAARQLRFLGVQISHALLSRCPDCDSERCGLPDDALLSVYLGGDVLWMDSPDGSPASLMPVAPDIVIVNSSVSPSVVDKWQDALAGSILVSIVGSTSRLVMDTDGLLAEAAAGIIGTMGYSDGPPMPYGFLFAETYVGIRAAGAAIAGLLAPPPNRASLRADVPVFESLFEAMDSPIEEVRYGDYDPQRSGGQRPGLVIPYGFFAVGSGYAGLISAASWDAFALLMGQPELMKQPEFATMEARLDNKSLVLATLQAWLDTLADPHELQELAADQLSATPVVTLRQLLVDDPLHLQETLDPAGTGPYRFGYPVS